MNWIPIPISFNQFSPGSDDRQSPALHIGVRMLFSYYVNQPHDLDSPLGEAFSQFSAIALPALVSLAGVAIGGEIAVLFAVVEHILEDIPPGGSILLLVDELLKSTAPREVLDIIKTLLDHFGTRLFALITTLDMLPVFTFEETVEGATLIANGRLMEYIPLHLFSHPESREIMADILVQVTSKDERAILEWVILDCGGHARSLEAVRSSWQLRGILKSYQLFANHIARTVETSIILSEAMAIAALRGEALEYSSLIDGVSFRKLISSGVFLNVFRSDLKSSDIPKVSMIQLRRFAISAPSFFSDLLLDLMALDSVEDFFWEKFEHFAFRFEMVSRYLGKSRSTFLRSFLDPRNPVDSRLIEGDYHLDFPWIARAKSAKVLPRRPHRRAFGLLPELLGNICLMPSGNPGFDFATVDVLPDGTSPYFDFGFVL